MSRISLNQVESSERFYRIPKVFTDENSYYCTMRLESKFAYGLLKDRFELSIKNKWVDKEKNIYLIFTVKELEKVLGCKKDKVHQIKRELAQYGLLEEERQGLNKPNRIYVLNIDTMRTSEKPTSNEANKERYGLISQKLVGDNVSKAEQLRQHLLSEIRKKEEGFIHVALEKVEKQLAQKQNIYNSLMTAAKTVDDIDGLIGTANELVELQMKYDNVLAQVE